MSKIKRYKSGRRIYTKWGNKTEQVTVPAKKQLQPEKFQKIPLVQDDITSELSDMFAIGYNQAEFFLDFYRLKNGKASLRSRIIMSPLNMKKFYKALRESIERHNRKKNS